MAFLCKYIWKLKVPLKIKIIMSFLYKKVIFAKDNLAKGNWKRCKKNVLFVTWRSLFSIFLLIVLLLSTSMIWRVLQFTFDITPPTNITNMFGNSLNRIDKASKARIRVGACALVCAILNYRNDIVLIRWEMLILCRLSISLPIGCKLGLCLLPEEQRPLMDFGCTRL